jgi:hypothetical protein
VKISLLLPAAFAAFAPLAGAQPTQLDAATFRVSVGGVAAGHETVEIFRHASADGATIEIQSDRHQSGVRTKAGLTTESDGRPRQLQIRVIERDGQGPVLSARVTASKLSVQSRARGGSEAIKDYLATPGTLILDDDLIGPYYAVALAGARAGVVVVLPRDRRQDSVALRQTGAEQLQLGGTTIAATRWVLGDGDARRELWTDASGRLLKVEIAARKLVAVRSEPPR